MTRMEPKEWLLGNGDIVQEPALEMSGSGKKVRIAGTKTSVYASELDQLLGEAVKGVAVAKNTYVWLESTRLDTQLVNALGYKPTETKAKLHLTHDPTNAGGQTVLWWRFKDPNSVYEAYLSIVLNNSRGVGNPQSLHVSLATPSRNYWGEAAETMIHIVKDDQFRDVVNALSHLDSQLPYKWQEFIRDNRPDWPLDELGQNVLAHPRAGVQALLKVVRQIEDLETIQVPDLGDPFEPSWRDLELYETNCNAALINDLTEYLDAAPSIEEAAGLYEKLLETLRSVGIVVGGKNSNDFMAALMEGEKGSLNMTIHHIAEEGNSVDHEHTLSVHLPSGTFIVECAHRDADKNVVAEKWEEALTMASLTGDEDTLLAYARAYAKEHSKKRTKTILKERKA